MPLILTQEHYSRSAGTYHASKSPVDKGDSHIFASRGKGSKQSNNIVIGYLTSGYSTFQLLFHGPKSDHNVDFIRKSILPKIENLKLTDPESAFFVMHNLLESIIKEHKTSHLSGLDFKLGFAITYSYPSHAYCTGFSFDGIKVCIRTKGTNKLSFNSDEPSRYSYTNFPHLPKHTTVFNLIIAPGDEIVMINHDRNLAFKPSVTDVKCSLLHSSFVQFKTLQGEQNDTAPSNDWIFGRMIAPDSNVLARVKTVDKIRWLKSIIVNFLLDCDKGLNSRFFPLSSAKSNMRLKHYLCLLDDDADLFTCLLICQFLLTDPEVSSWFRHCNKINSDALTNMAPILEESYLYLNDAKLTIEEIESLKEHIKLALDKGIDLEFMSAISHSS